MSRSPSRPLLAAFALLLAGSSSALAVDAQAFADRLKAAMAPSARLEFGSVSSEGEDVILNDARLLPGEPTGTPFALGMLRFQNVSGSNAEGWRAERLQVADISQTSGDATTTATNIVMDGLTIRPEGASSVVSPLFVERTAVGSVAVERKGQNLLTASDIGVDTRTAGADGLASSLTLGRFQIDPAAADNPGAAQVMNDLGYQQIVGSMRGEGSWQPGTGELSLSELELAVENAGQLNLDYTITGYTPSFIQSLSQVSEQLQASNGQNQNAGMAVIGLVSQLYLKSAEISFEDRSLTNRLLDYFAKQNNQPREQFVQSLNAMVPMGLAYLQNPEFQAEVAGAVENFLADPRSIRVAVEPPAPIPATQILGAAMGAPQTLPQVLNLAVRSGE